MRALTHSKGNTDRSFENVYRLLIEIFKKVDGIEYGIDSTGGGFFSIVTSKGLYKTVINTFKRGSTLPESSVDPSVSGGDAGTLSKFGDSMPAQYSSWKYDFPLTKDSTAGSLVYIPANWILEKVVVIVTTAFDNSATIKFTDDSGDIIPTGDFDLSELNGAFEAPKWKTYSSADTLTYTLAGSPSVGALTVLVFGSPKTK